MVTRERTFQYPPWCQCWNAVFVFLGANTDREHRCHQHCSRYPEQTPLCSREVGRYQLFQWVSWSTGRRFAGRKSVPRV